MRPVAYDKKYWGGGHTPRESTPGSRSGMTRGGSGVNYRGPKGSGVGGAGAVNKLNAGFEFEVSAIVEALNIMYKAAGILDPNSKNGSRIVTITAEEVKNGIGDQLYHDALKHKESIAHVFDWDSVVDRTPSRGSVVKKDKKGKKTKTTRKRTETAKKRRLDKKQQGPKQYNDTAVKFVPKIKPKVPLFFLRNVGKGKNIRSVVGFMEATETDYDEEVYYIELWRPEGLGKHWFNDQAAKLESVSTIKKQSSRPSPRRTGGGAGVTGGRDGKRIIQLFGSGQDFRLVHFKTYTRKNQYESAFSAFFRTFSTTKASQSTVQTMIRLQKSIEKVYIKEIDRVSARQSQAAQALTLGSVIKTTARGGMRVQPLRLTLYGKAIKRLPPLDNSGIAALVAEIEKSIAKDSPASYNLAGRAMNEPVRKLKHLGPSLRDGRESGGAWSWSRT